MKPIELDPSDKISLTAVFFWDQNKLMILPWTPENLKIAISAINKDAGQMHITINGHVIATMFDSLVPEKVVVETLNGYQRFHEDNFDAITTFVTTP